MSEQEIRNRIAEMRKSPRSALNNKRYWSKADTDSLKNQFIMGIGISEIAVDLERTERTVLERCHKLGLYGSMNGKRPKELVCLCKDCSFFEKPDKCHKPKEDANV